MGDVVVAALVNGVLEKLTSTVIKELALLWGLKDDISNLKDDFDRIKVVIQDAEEKQVKENAVELWLNRLKSTSLMVENLLDDISTEALLQRLHNECGIKYKVRAFFSCAHNQLLFRIRLAHRVKYIRMKLNDIESKRDKLNLTPSCDVSHVDVELQVLDRETSSLIHDSSDIFGRDKEVEMLTKNICNKDIGKYDNRKIRVYGIWGMGGVGKTTLAQLVYNHERVNKTFELKCWVYVSKRFQVREIIKNIIEFINECGCTITKLETLKKALQNKLKGKKILIVLDDVWIEEKEKAQWDQLSETFSCGGEGSIVLITTRYQTTCRMMAKVPELQHKLGCLTEEDSWSLFEKLAFPEGREVYNMNELKLIGKEIVKKCEGLPLAVKTLGSLMLSKSSISDWQHVNCGIIRELEDNNVMSVLKLSYDNLLPHLRRCFAYCCLFPKDYEIEKDEMILLWVVNGFIPPREELDPHMLGEKIFNCLVWRSFFQVIRENKFNMHDLMHKMARHMMGGDCLVIEPHMADVNIPNDTLHLSSSCPNFQFPGKDLEKLTSLRTIFSFGPVYECNIDQIFNHVYLKVLYLCGSSLRILPESICKLKHLKYLNLSKSCITVLPESIMYLQNLEMLILSSCNSLHELPESIGKLKHLKHLNLSKSCIKTLPKSIINLQNLQTLILSSCHKLSKLPKGLKFMRKLQCLDIYNCDNLQHLPKGIKELTSLRILPCFRVGNESGAEIEELGELNLIEGKLEILGLDNVRGLSKAKSANLICKRNLLNLGLIWIKEGKPKIINYDEEVLEGLSPAPDSSLKFLKVSGYSGKIMSPSWMVNLKNLTEIQFYQCENCEHIPILGRLPNLRVIKLKLMYSLKCFHDKEIMLGDPTDIFLCLQELDIYMCPNLVSLPCNLPKLEVLRIYLCEQLVSLPGNLPNIRKLHLKGCDELVSLPDEIQSFKNLNEVVILGCKHLFNRCEKDKGIDWCKISHIPDLKIEQRSFEYKLRFRMMNDVRDDL